MIQKGISATLCKLDYLIINNVLRINSDFIHRKCSAKCIIGK